MADIAYPFLRDLYSQRLELNVTAGTSINPGDWVWWNGTTLKSVGGSADNLVATWASEEVARRDAICRCVGIADFQCNSDDKHDRTVAVRQHGIVKVPCTSFTPVIGDMVGFEKASGNYLEAQKVQRVTHPSDAIGIVVEDPGAASTEVDIMFFGAFFFRLTSLVKTLGPLYVADLSGANNILIDYNFYDRVRIVGVGGQVITAITTGDSTTTLKKGANALDETLVLPTSGSAIGDHVYTEMVGASNPDRLLFEHDDDFDMVNDATPDAGAAMIWVDYMPVGLLA